MCLEGHCVELRARDQVALYEYRAKAGREIPIMLLEPVNTTP
jgi:hypothetical protein